LLYRPQKVRFWCSVFDLYPFLPLQPFRYVRYARCERDDDGDSAQLIICRLKAISATIFSTPLPLPRPSSCPTLVSRVSFSPSRLFTSFASLLIRFRLLDRHSFILFKPFPSVRFASSLVLSSSALCPLCRPDFSSSSSSSSSAENQTRNCSRTFFSETYQFQKLLLFTFKLLF
jgi:hypothetical protein